MNKLTNYSTPKLFNRLLTNTSKKNYWHYIGELQKRKTTKIFEKSIHLTQSTNAHKKIIGIRILAQLGTPRIKPKKIKSHLFKLLQTAQEKNVICALLYAIGHNNKKLSPKQVELLCSFATYKSVKIKRALVFALLAVKADCAIDTLIKLSTHKKAVIRDWATFGLGSQLTTNNQKIRKALWNRVTDTDQITRHEAMVGLANRKDPKLKKVLLKELEKTAAPDLLLLDAVEAYNDKSFIPIIKQYIQHNKISKKMNENDLLELLKKLTQKSNA